MAKFAAKDSNKNITLSPHGTGKVVVGTGAVDATVQSDGNHNLVLQTGNATTGSITITDGANGNIAITPNGTGEVDISKADIDGGTLGGFTIDGSWTAASQTCADLGSVTTADLNGGTIDGMAINSTTIGATSHTTGKFTTCDATTDFTIGGTVMTDGQIADDGNFTFDITGDLTVDVDGGDVYYKDAGTTFLHVSFDGTDTTITGP